MLMRMVHVDCDTVVSQYSVKPNDKTMGYLGAFIVPVIFWKPRDFIVLLEAVWLCARCSFWFFYAAVIFGRL